MRAADIVVNLGVDQKLGRVYAEPVHKMRTEGQMPDTYSGGTR